MRQVHSVNDTMAWCARAPAVMARVHVLPRDLNFVYTDADVDGSDDEVALDTDMVGMRVRKRSRDPAGQYTVTFVERNGHCYAAGLSMLPGRILVGPTLQPQLWRDVLRKHQVEDCADCADGSAVAEGIASFVVGANCTEDCVGQSSYMRSNGNRVVACATRCSLSGTPSLFLSLVEVDGSLELNPMSASLRIPDSAPFADADLVGVVSSGAGTHDVFFAGADNVFILQIPQSVPMHGILDLNIGVIEYTCRTGDGDNGEDVCDAWSMPLQVRKRSCPGTPPMWESSARHSCHSDVPCNI